MKTPQATLGVQRTDVTLATLDKLLSGNGLLFHINVWVANQSNVTVTDGI